MTVLAIDPGNVESAYVVIGHDLRPLQHGKLPNEELRVALRDGRLGMSARDCAVEMVASYGMPVGADVFDTCVWIGRFVEVLTLRRGQEPQRVTRNPVKLHICHDSRAKDSNIIQALVDRFAYGKPNRGKGTKADPGFFHGFAADIWQAYALAVYVHDTEGTR